MTNEELKEAWQKGLEVEYYDPFKSKWVYIANPNWRPCIQYRIKPTNPEPYYPNPQPIDVIQAWGLNFNLGNVVKYVARAGKKEGNTKEADLKKAIDYLQHELKATENNHNNQSARPQGSDNIIYTGSDY